MTESKELAAARLFYDAGLSRKAVARQMWISEETVKTHLSKFRRRHRISSREDAKFWFANFAGTPAPVVNA